MLYSIGLMSGTSMDGIDAALLHTDGAGQLIPLGHISVAYDPLFKKCLKATERAVKACKGDLTAAAAAYPTVLEAYLQEELGLRGAALAAEYTSAKHRAPSVAAVIEASTRLHAEAVAALLLEVKKTGEEIDIIGYHGQTLFHDPRQKISIQIGDARLLATLTGISVVNNFRQADLAAGGEGAPLAPLYHQALAEQSGMLPVAVVNCGGIANISVITDATLAGVVGFDTGPGNGLVDAWVRRSTQGAETMDKDGQYGMRGRVDLRVLEALFEKALVCCDIAPSAAPEVPPQTGPRCAVELGGGPQAQHSKRYAHYFERLPPKSLDIRDMQLIPELAQLSLEDGAATLEAFTAEAIVRSLELLSLPPAAVPRRWVLAGGGWHNPVIRRELSERLQARYHEAFHLQTADEVGWSTAALEAQIFAYLAVRSLKNEPLTLPATTGVKVPLSGGITHLAARGPTPSVKQALQQARPILRGYVFSHNPEINHLIQRHQAQKGPAKKLLTTELPHPLTLNLSTLAQQDLAAGYQALMAVDQQALHTLAALEDQLQKLQSHCQAVLLSGGRIFIGGCGSAGRAAMEAEVLFRRAYPSQKECVIAVPAGGDVAMIRAAEGLEDSYAAGEASLAAAGWSAADLYIGVSASGGAEFVRGQMEYVLKHSPRFAPVFMIANPLAECATRFSQEDAVQKLSFCVGEMALAGSTRMQAATVQLAVLGYALLQTEVAGWQHFLLEEVLQPLPLEALLALTRQELAAYQAGDYTLYCVSAENALTVATDLTERAPTFSWPYFENEADLHKSAATSSYCRLSIEGEMTRQSAWEALLGRPLRPLAAPEKAFLLGYDLTAGIIEARAQYMPEAKLIRLTLEFLKPREPVTSSLGQLCQHLRLKMALNMHSTLVAGAMDAYHGNLMTSVQASNEKLIERALALTRKRLALLAPNRTEISDAALQEALYNQMLLYHPGDSVVINTCDALLYHTEEKDIYT